MTFSYDDVRRLASDPESDWDTLHWIAEQYPELRPDVAANPATYPELLEALADLGDPAITAALMHRFNPDTDPSELPEPTDDIPLPVGVGRGTDGGEDETAEGSSDDAAVAPEEDQPAGGGDDAAPTTEPSEPQGSDASAHPAEPLSEQSPDGETESTTGPHAVVEADAEPVATPEPGSLPAPTRPSPSAPSEESAAPGQDSEEPSGQAADTDRSDAGPAAWAQSAEAQEPAGTVEASDATETLGAARHDTPGEPHAAPRRAELPPVGTAAPEAAQAILGAGSAPVEPRPRASRAGASGAATATPVEDRHRHSRVFVLLFAVILPLIALAAITTLIVALLGDGGGPLADPDASTGAAETSSSGDSSESEAAPTGVTLEEARTTLADLPQQSSCQDVTDDVDVFTAYAELAAEEGSWSAEDDQLVQTTLEQLQTECGALQSAQVHQQLADGPEEQPLASAARDMGTGWVETAFPAEDAAELTSFTTPGGNVRCEMGDQLRCSIVEHSISSPESCEGEDMTLRSTLRTTAAADCDDPVTEGDREVLPYGQTTANEYFACTSFRSKLSCWNQVTGEGFNLSRSEYSTY